MKEREIIHIIIAILVLAIVISFSELVTLDFSYLGTGILFAFIVIGVNLLAKKFVANMLDSDVENSLWFWSRYGFRPNASLKKEIPLGIILPILLTAFSAGLIKITTILTYETSALKRRAAKRFGYYSFTEMTDWHIALIGASGIVATLALSFITYWIPSLEALARIAAFYAFFNMIPFSKLDGAQIFYGSRVLWTTLAIIAAIFTGYALFLV